MENVGGLVELVAKWRLRMAHADAMEKSCADEANKNWWSGVSQQAEECADELEAALSAHGGLLFTQVDMERFAGYVAAAREERLKSAHGENASVQPPVVDEVWLRQAIEEFKYLSGRTDLPMQDRERWRALNAAIGATP